MRPARVFLALAAVAGLLFVFATPPFRYPDEPGHFLRIARLSAALFAGQRPDPGIAPLPARMVEDFQYFSARIPQVAHGRPYRAAEIVSRLRAAGSTDGFVAMPVPPPQLAYHDVAYIVPAAAFAIASAFEASLVITLWAARLAVLVASLMFTVVAIRLAPGWTRWTLAVASLVPMAAYLRASSSPDGLVNAAALLATAAFLRGAERDDAPGWGLFVAALAACAFLGLVKFPYICLLLLSLAWLRSGAGQDRRRGGAFVATLWVATLAVTAWHLAGALALASSLRPGGDPGEFALADKLDLLVHHPLSVAAIFLRTALAVPGAVYSAIARFGAMDINPLPLLHVGVVLWIVGFLYLERRALAQGVTRTMGVLMWLTFVAQYFAVLAALWVTFTPKSAAMVIGLQGRYVLPALACALLGVGLFLRKPMLSPPQESWLPVGTYVAVGAAIILAAAFVSALLGEFYGLQGLQVICLHAYCGGS